MADYKAKIEKHRTEKDRYLKQHHQSPLPQRLREKFDSLEYYSVDQAMNKELELHRYVDVETLELDTSTGDTQNYERIGYVEFEVNSETAKLNVYQPLQGDHYFVPFRDKTSGDETYGAGRYLDPEIRNGTVHLDFNKAYNPFCAYSERYTCPLPPAENWLDIPIRAGEKDFDLKD